FCQNPVCTVRSTNDPARVIQPVALTARSITHLSHQPLTFAQNRVTEPAPFTPPSTNSWSTWNSPSLRALPASTPFTSRSQSQYHLLKLSVYNGRSFAAQTLGRSGRFT